MDWSKLIETDKIIKIKTESKNVEYTLATIKEMIVDGIIDKYEGHCDDNWEKIKKFAQAIKDNGDLDDIFRVDYDLAMERRYITIWVLLNSLKANGLHEDDFCDFESNCVATANKQLIEEYL